MVFFLSLFSCKLDEQLSPNGNRFVVLFICWDTPSGNRVFDQTCQVSSFYFRNTVVFFVYIYLYTPHKGGIPELDKKFINQSINQSNVICIAPKSKVCSKALRHRRNNKSLMVGLLKQVGFQKCLECVEGCCVPDVIGKFIPD